MEPFEYRRAADTSQAFELLSPGEEGARPLAGGTDVVPLLKDRVIRPARLVDIKRVRDLDRGIRVTDGDVTLGALTTLADLVDHQGLAERAALLGEAARSAATPQLRAVATVAGNLLQRPRCWYFRNPAFHCWLEGGDDCPAREGRNDRHAIFAGAEPSPCCAVHPSDLAPCFVALDAQVLLRGPAGGERLMAVEELFRAPTPERRTETVLNGELVVEIRLPPLPDGTRTGYRKAMARESWSFALAAVASRLQVRDGRIADARIVLGGVAGVPWRAREAEAALIDAAPSDDVFDRAAGLALEDAQPLAHNAYKVPLTRGLVGSILRDLAR